MGARGVAVWRSESFNLVLPNDRVKASDSEQSDGRHAAFARAGTQPKTILMFGSPISHRALHSWRLFATKVGRLVGSASRLDTDQKWHGRKTVASLMHLPPYPALPTFQSAVIAQMNGNVIVQFFERSSKNTVHI